MVPWLNKKKLKSRLRLRNKHWDSVKVRKCESYADCQSAVYKAEYGSEKSGCQPDIII
jgi:hypothetical protein